MALGLFPGLLWEDGSAGEVEEFVLRGEGAVRGVEGEVFDGGFWVLLRDGFGEVEASDLEAVEEESSAAGVEVVRGDTLQDFSDGGLDGGAVLGHGHVEGADTGLAGVRVGDRFSTPASKLAGDPGFAAGVVVVAEVLVAQSEGTAAMSVGEDVAALEAPGFVAAA